MKDLRSASQQYLADKGCKSNGQKYTAFDVVNMLNDFAQEQVKNCSIPDVVNRRELLLAFCEFMHNGTYDSHNTTHSQDVDAFLESQ